MNIAFVTTQTVEGSTVIGRIAPLAQELAGKHSVHILVHASSSTPRGDLPAYKVHVIGADPFQKTENGKKRLSGVSLLWRIKWNAIMAAARLWKLRPDVVVIVKSQPESVFAAWAYSIFRNPMFILDVDDFELTANKLNSIWQRAAVHFAERMGAKLADHIVTASPFLQDHFQQLAPNKKVIMIPTGIRPAAYAGKGETSKNPLFAYIGSVSIASGHRVDLLPEILAQVRAQLPQATLTIAGSGDDIAKLKKEFADRGLADAVSWTGRFAPEDVPSLVSASAVVVDPIDASISNRAKSSFRVLAAQLYGAALVTSNVGIRPQLIPKEFHDRFFAAPGDARSYAAKITAMLTGQLSGEERATLKTHVSRYSWKNLAAQYADLWNS